MILLYSLLFFFVLIKNVCTDDDKIISLIVSSFYGNYAAYLSFGKPPQTVYFNFDISSPFSYTCSKAFQRGHSVTEYQDLRKRIAIGKVTDILVDQLRDTVTISTNNITIQHFTYYYITIKTDIHENAIGFAYKMEDDSFSLIDKLRRDEFIKRRVIYFQNYEQNNPKVFIGGIPKEYELPYKAKCKINEKLTQWSCLLKEIKFGNLSFELNEFATFQNLDNSISVPEQIFTTINSTILKPYYDSGDCKHSDNAKPYLIMCSYAIISHFPHFEITFDNNVYELTFDELFDQIIESCFLNIYTNDENNWVFGSSLFKKYNPMFDWDNKEITFYSQTEIKSIGGISEKNNKGTFIILIFNICIMCSMIVLLVLFKKIKDISL